MTQTTQPRKTPWYTLLDGAYKITVNHPNTTIIHRKNYKSSDGIDIVKARINKIKLEYPSWDITSIYIYNHRSPREIVITCD